MRQSLPKRPTNMRGTGCEQCSSEQGAPCRLHQEAGEERTDKGAEAQAVRGPRPSCQAPGEAPHVSKTPPALSSSPLPAPPVPGSFMPQPLHRPSLYQECISTSCPPHPQANCYLAFRSQLKPTPSVKPPSPSPAPLSAQLHSLCSQSTWAIPLSALIMLYFSQLLSAFLLYFSTRFLQRLCLT